MKQMQRSREASQNRTDTPKDADALALPLDPLTRACGVYPSVHSLKRVPASNQAAFLLCNGTSGVAVSVAVPTAPTVARLRLSALDGLLMEFHAAATRSIDSCTSAFQLTNSLVDFVFPVLFHAWERLDFSSVASLAVVLAAKAVAALNARFKAPWETVWHLLMAIRGQLLASMPHLDGAASLDALILRHARESLKKDGCLFSRAAVRSALQLASKETVIQAVRTMDALDKRVPPEASPTNEGGRSWPGFYGSVAYHAQRISLGDPAALGSFEHFVVQWIAENVSCEQGRDGAWVVAPNAQCLSPALCLGHLLLARGVHMTAVVTPQHTTLCRRPHSSGILFLTPRCNEDRYEDIVLACDLLASCGSLPLALATSLLPGHRRPHAALALLHIAASQSWHSRLLDGTFGSEGTVQVYRDNCARLELDVFGSSESFLEALTDPRGAHQEDELLQVLAWSLLSDPHSIAALLEQVPELQHIVVHAVALAAAELATRLLHCVGRTSRHPDRSVQKALEDCSDFWDAVGQTRIERIGSSDTLLSNIAQLYEEKAGGGARQLLPHERMLVDSFRLCSLVSFVYDIVTRLHASCLEKGVDPSPLALLLSIAGRGVFLELEYVQSFVVTAVQKQLGTPSSDVQFLKLVLDTCGVEKSDDARLQRRFHELSDKLRTELFQLQMANGGSAPQSLALPPAVASFDYTDPPKLHEGALSPTTSPAMPAPSELQKDLLCLPLHEELQSTGVRHYTSVSKNWHLRYWAAERMTEYWEFVHSRRFIQQRSANASAPQNQRMLTCAGELGCALYSTLSQLSAPSPRRYSITQREDAVSVQAVAVTVAEHQVEQPAATKANELTNKHVETDGVDTAAVVMRIIEGEAHSAPPVLDDGHRLFRPEDVAWWESETPSNAKPQGRMSPYLDAHNLAPVPTEQALHDLLASAESSSPSEDALPRHHHRSHHCHHHANKHKYAPAVQQQPHLPQKTAPDLWSPAQPRLLSVPNRAFEVPQATSLQPPNLEMAPSFPSLLQLPGQPAERPHVVLPRFEMGVSSGAAVPASLPAVPFTPGGQLLPPAAVPPPVIGGVLPIPSLPVAKPADAPISLKQQGIVNLEEFELARRQQKAERKLRRELQRKEREARQASTSTSESHGGSVGPSPKAGATSAAPVQLPITQPNVMKTEDLQRAYVHLADEKPLPEGISALKNPSTGRVELINNEAMHLPGTTNTVLTPSEEIAFRKHIDNLLAEHNMRATLNVGIDYANDATRRDVPAGSGVDGPKARDGGAPNADVISILAARAQAAQELQQAAVVEAQQKQVDMLRTLIDEMRRGAQPSAPDKTSSTSTAAPLPAAMEPSVLQLAQAANNTAEQRNRDAKLQEHIQKLETTLCEQQVMLQQQAACACPAGAAKAADSQSRHLCGDNAIISF